MYGDLTSKRRKSLIQITDDYFIHANDYQYLLIKETKGTKKAIGYFDTVASALEGYVKHTKRELVKGTDMTLAEAITAFRQIHADVKELLPEDM